MDQNYKTLNQWEKVLLLFLSPRHVCEEMPSLGVLSVGT